MPRAVGRGGRGGRCGRGGRGGRGGSRSRRRTQPTEPKQDVEQDLDITTDVKGFFLGTASIKSHVKAQTENRLRYAAAMCLMSDLNMEISLNARVRALIAALARNDTELDQALLSSRSLYGLPEVLKAVQSLDSSRQIRVHERKLKRLETQPGKVKKRTLGKIRSAINNLNASKPQEGSASGAVCRKVAEWARGHRKDELEFFALHMPRDPWKKLADICHFNPQKDFPTLPWFLPYCFTGEAPAETMVKDCLDLTAENVNDKVSSVDVPFSHIKQFSDKLTLESKARIASYTKKLDTVIWHYEDLACPEVDRIISDRLGSGEQIDLPYGKLMERLLTVKIMTGDTPPEFRPKHGENTVRTEPAPFYQHLLRHAEEKLSEMSLPLEAPMIVIGDRSASMDIAIRTATIISSLLTAIGSAKLVFFNNANHEPPFIPKNVEEVLRLALTVQADCSTAPAASLYPLYESKTLVKTIVMVTDEEENTACQNGDRFAALYKKYHDEVYPAKLVFISFLRHQHSEGQMVEALKREGFNPLQFRLEASRPDLTRLDTILGSLATDSTSFEDRLKEMMEKIEREGLKEVFRTYCNKEDPMDQ